VKVELGGVAGVVAPLIGKQPQDTHVWILGGKAPAFVKMEGPLYQGAPIWRIELTKPGVAAIATLGALDIAVLVSNLATPNLAVENRALRQLRSW